MREIDRKAARAFLTGSRFKSKNTKVIIENGQVKMYLFGNLIAETRVDGTYINHCGWTTNTTRNRLNALGAKIRISQGMFIVNEKFNWEKGWIKL